MKEEHGMLILLPLPLLNFFYCIDAGRVDMDPVLFQIVYLGMHAVRLFLHTFCAVSRLLPHLDTVRLRRIAPHTQALAELPFRQPDDLIRIHRIHVQLPT